MKLQTDFRNPVGGFEPRITVPYMTYPTEIHLYVTHILGGSENFNTGYEKAMADRKHQRLVERFLLIIVWQMFDWAAIFHCRVVKDMISFISISDGLVWLCASSLDSICNCRTIEVVTKKTKRRTSNENDVKVRREKEHGRNNRRKKRKKRK